MSRADEGVNPTSHEGHVAVSGDGENESHWQLLLLISSCDSGRAHWSGKVGQVRKRESEKARKRESKVMTHAILLVVERDVAEHTARAM